MTDLSDAELRVKAAQLVGELIHLYHVDAHVETMANAVETALLAVREAQRARDAKLLCPNCENDIPLVGIRHQVEGTPPGETRSVVVYDSVCEAAAIRGA